MISVGKFNASLNDAKALLTDLKLFKSFGPKNQGDYSDAFKKVCRSGRHTEIYNTVRDNLDYEIVLADDSFLQFCRGDKYLRMCYIENPNFTCSKEDFLRTIFTDIDENKIDEMIADLVSDEEYEQYLNEMEGNANLMFIRYDFDTNGYAPLQHSCSHLHIGMRESVRIPLSIAITPLQFVIFCLRLAYPEQWQKLHKDKDTLTATLQSIKQQNPNLPSTYWQPEETLDLFIS